MKENPYDHLDESAHRIAYLIAGFLKNSLTEEEHEELDVWVTADDRNMKLFEELTDERNIAANMAWMEQVRSREAYIALQKKLKTPKKRFKTARVWMAAASLVLLAGLIFFLKDGMDKKINRKELVNDDSLIQPGSNKATLILDDGSVIDLTTAKNGLIKYVQGSDILKTADGQLAYEAHGSGEFSEVVHTLSVPAGGQFQLTLPDQTRVWLNASTTIRYPAHFSSGERLVELRGEAYFEVTKNEHQPFRVKLADSADVTVMGTHFNAMAYENEEIKEITLLEGSVKVSHWTSFNGQQSATITPGQQAVMTQQSPVNVRDQIDTTGITGWKDGWFVFHDAPIESIMRQVERWYDVKVVYKTKTAQLFNATILRNERLSKLLHLLELNGYVHFKTEKKTIYVLP